MTQAGPRERLIASAITLVRERGVEATGLADLLEHSGTARRSIYQHFPGGKLEMIEQSTRLAGAWIGQMISSAGDESPPVLVRTLVEQTKRNLVAGDFTQGCPIMAAATAPPEAAQVRAAAAAAFESWTIVIADRLTAGGRSPEQARSLAGFIVSSVEGALMRAVVARSSEPLDQAAEHLPGLLGETTTLAP